MVFPDGNTMDPRDVLRYSPLVNDLLGEPDQSEPVPGWNDMAANPWSSGPFPGLSPVASPGGVPDWVDLSDSWFSDPSETQQAAQAPQVTQTQQVNKEQSLEDGFLELSKWLADQNENIEAGPQIANSSVIEENIPEAGLQTFNSPVIEYNNNNSPEAGLQVSSSPVSVQQPEQLSNDVDGEFDLDDLFGPVPDDNAKPEVIDLTADDGGGDSVSTHSSGSYVNIELGGQEQNKHSSGSYVNMDFGSQEQNKQLYLPREPEKVHWSDWALETGYNILHQKPMQQGYSGEYTDPRLANAFGKPIDNRGVYNDPSMLRNYPQAPPSLPKPQPPRPAPAPAPAPAPGSGRSRPKTTGAKVPGPIPAGVSKRPRASRPAPIQVPAPVNSNSFDDNINMTEANYRPQIDQRLIPTTLIVGSGYYGSYQNTFTTGEAAREHRRSSREAAKTGAADVERVKRYGRAFWVRHIYESMIDTSNITDRSTSIHRLRFMSDKGFDQTDLEAAAHHVFDKALAVHEKGWCRPKVYHKNHVRGKLVDKAATSLELRLALICELLKEKKAMVDDAVRGGVTLALLVDNPTARGFTKSSNDTGNEKRGRRLQVAKALEDLADQDDHDDDSGDQEDQE